MDFFRKIVNGWAGKALLGLVIVLFGAYGIDSLMVLTRQGKPAAEVNGEEISSAHLDRSVEFERRSILANKSENKDLSSVSPEVLRPRILDSLIDRLLLSQIATNLGVSASDDSIVKWIVSFPQFQTEGKFDNTLFENTVKQLGMTPQAFSSEIRKDFFINQLRQGISDSAFVTDQELQRLIELQQQARAFRYTTLPYAWFSTQIKINDEEITKYYREHEDQFRREERAKFQYVELTSESFEKDIIVTDEDITKAYEAYKNDLKKLESREAAHILINIDADTTETQARQRLEQVQEQLKQGAAFDLLAKQFSEDQGSASQGGYLGFSERGGDFLPSFDEALFSIEKQGDYSSVIKTDYGVHIIKLLSVKKPEVESMENKRNDLIAVLKKEKSLVSYHGVFDVLKSLAFESGDLQPLVDKFKLSLQATDWINASPTKEGLFSSEAVIKAAFNDSLQDGYNSEVIELDQGKAVVLRQLAYEPSELRPLTEVRATIVGFLTAEKSQDAAEKAGRELIAQVRAGGEIPLSVHDHPITWIKHEKMTRASGGVPTLLLNKVFAMPRQVSELGGQAALSTKESTATANSSTSDLTTTGLTTAALAEAPIQPTADKSAKSDSNSIISNSLTPNNPVSNKMKTVLDGVSGADGFIIIDLLSVTPGKFDLKPEESREMRAYLSSQLGRLSFDDFFIQHQKQAKIVRR